MAKFHGEVGYVHPSAETPPGSGKWINQIVEVEAFGDVTQNIRRLDSGEKVNDDISLQNSISIVADAYAMEHYSTIRYIRYDGILWTVTTVQVQRPRLILAFGGVYNGPTP